MANPWPSRGRSPKRAGRRCTTWRRQTDPNPGVAVVFPLEQGGAIRAATVTAADWDQPEIVDEVRGPVFFKQTRRGRLRLPGADPGRSWPELELTYKYFARLPYVLVYFRLVFPEDTGVFGIYADMVSADRAQFNHYTFRPVSPDLPLTDVEEMGHILVDAAWTADLPPGLVFSGFLPYDLPRMTCHGTPSSTSTRSRTLEPRNQAGPQGADLG